MPEKENVDVREFRLGVYKHFKGDMYFALMVGKDADTGMDVVIYIPLYDDPARGTRAWVRPLEDFMGTKQLEDGTVVNRFEFISER